MSVFHGISPMSRAAVFTLLFGALLSVALFAGVRRYEMQEATFTF